MITKRFEISNLGIYDTQRCIWIDRVTQEKVGQRIFTEYCNFLNEGHKATDDVYFYRDALLRRIKLVNKLCEDFAFTKEAQINGYSFFLLEKLLEADPKRLIDEARQEVEMRSNEGTNI